MEKIILFRDFGMVVEDTTAPAKPTTKPTTKPTIKPRQPFRRIAPDPNPKNFNDAYTALTNRYKMLVILKEKGRL